MGLLLVIAYIFPENGIALSDKIKLKYPSIGSLMNNEKPKYAAIPDVVAYADTASLNALKSIAEKPIEVIVATDSLISDSSITSETIIEKEPVKKVDIKSQRIDFLNGDASILYGFFDKLEEAREKRKPLRIVHFGDSQIEGDRISGFIRERLQSRFGGGGPGLVPALKVYNQASVLHENSGNWYRYTIFGNVDKTVQHKRYGVMCAFSRFTPIFSDSSNISDLVTATAKYSTKSSIYPSAKKFQRVKVYYGKSDTTTSLEVLTDERPYVTHNLDGNQDLNIKTINFDVATNNATLVFKGAISPDIYGVSLEMPYGISVDNIAMRGGSGTVFNKMDRGVLSAMLKDMDTELIIMQFGGNVMPYIKDEKGCKEYGNWFYSQIATLKAAKPGVAIIVIGPADMSVKKEDYFETYPYLENVRDALKEASFKAGAGFWDMYLAMGGKNSMPSWVAADPSLASTDYIHFSPRGARIIAELFYEALNYEFENYRYKNAEANKE
jgi:lysophospholipase L1-like esterase